MDSESYEYKKACKTIEIYNLDNKKTDERSGRKGLFKQIFFPLKRLAEAKTLFTSHKTVENYSRYNKTKKEETQTLSDSWIAFIENDGFRII